MNRLLIVCIILLVTYSSFSQVLNNTIFTIDSDTLYAYKYKNNINKKCNLTYIENSKADYALRFSSYGNSIDIYSNNGKSWGYLHLFVYEQGYFSPTGNVFKMTFAINEVKAKQILEIIKSNSISTLPSDRQTKDWKFGFDGITYLLESKNDSLYSFKQYWTPSIQKEVKEAIIIEDFKTRIYEICEFEKNYAVFNNLIPFISYSTGGRAMTTRIRTKKEYKAYKRNKRKAKKIYDGEL